MLRKTLLIIFISIILISCNNSDKEQTSVVSASALNIRKDASVDSEIIGKLHKGDIVSIDTIINDFAYITFKDQKGFVAKEYLTDNEEMLFTSLFKEMTTSEVISIIIGFILLCIVFARIVSLFYYKFVPEIDSGFNFVQTNKNNFFRRRYNSTVYILFGSKRQHTLLNYWVYISLFWILVPFLFLNLHISSELRNPNPLILNAINLEIKYPITTFFLIASILIPAIIFIVKYNKHSNQSRNKYIITSIFTSIIAVPLMVVSIIIAVRWLLIILIFAMNFLLSRRVVVINGDSGIAWL